MTLQQLADYLAVTGAEYATIDGDHMKAFVYHRSYDGRRIFFAETVELI